MPTNSTQIEQDDSLTSFIMSMTMVVLSEIGDKTFLLAAIMAMKYPRWTVFSASYSSLVLMTLLSAYAGSVLPILVSQKFTQAIAALLFLIFGFRLISEGLAMSNEIGVQEEMDEVEAEISYSNIDPMEMAEFGASNSVNNNNNNNNQKNISSSPQQILSKTPMATLMTVKERFYNFASFIFSPAWAQTFVMTFLGEWGDRSQIATIAMSARPKFWIIVLGVLAGHFLCSLAAVIGGKLLASKISVRKVTLAGGAAFFDFCNCLFLPIFTSALLVPGTCT